MPGRMNRDRQGSREGGEVDKQMSARVSLVAIREVWAVVTAAAMVCVAVGAFLLGGIIGQQRLYQSWTDQKLDKLARILQADAYEGVESNYSSAAQVYLTGTIKDMATREALRD